MVDAVRASSIPSSAVEPTGFPPGTVLDALVESINGLKKVYIWAGKMSRNICRMVEIP